MVAGFVLLVAQSPLWAAPRPASYRQLNMSASSSKLAIFPKSHSLSCNDRTLSRSRSVWRSEGHHPMPCRSMWINGQLPSAPPLTVKCFQQRLSPSSRARPHPARLHPSPGRLRSARRTEPVDSSGCLRPSPKYRTAVPSANMAMYSSRDSSLVPVSNTLLSP